MSAAFELTVLMPCLNEAETVAVCVAKALRWMEAREVQGEVLIADNGSTDGSRDLAQQAGARVITVQAKGYGNALRAGIAAARGRFVIMGDADASYDFSHLEPFLENLRAGCDLVMGNRFRGGIAPGAMPPLHRYLGNPVLSGLARFLFGGEVGDFHCGLRGFHRERMLAVGLNAEGMEFATEMVVKALRSGLRVREVPTTLSPDGRSRPPHLRSWRDGWRHLRFMLLHAPEWLFIYPGILLMAAGVLMMFWVWAFIGGRLGAGFLWLSAAGVTGGFQAAVFGLWARAVVMNSGTSAGRTSPSWLHGRFRLEHGLIAGGILLALGAAGVFASLAGMMGGFAPPSVAPALTVLLLGLLIALNAFFGEVLAMARRSNRRSGDQSGEPRHESTQPPKVKG